MKIAILGAGSWGLSLTVHLKRAGHDPRLWVYDPVQAMQLTKDRHNTKLLPGAELDPSVLVSHELSPVLAEAEGVVFVVPSHALRKTAVKVSSLISKSVWVACASKGLEEDTQMRMSEVLKQNLKNSNPIAVLSGPSHAEEVFKRMPTTVVAASEDAVLAGAVQSVFHAEYFRVYSSTDLVGVELGGALKNVIAIAAGITDGLGLGDNAKAALMTRGLHEMTRLGTALGAQATTFAGLAGMGDLIVTCTSRHSRNRLLGEKLGKGASLQMALSEMVMIAEGVKTAKSAWALAQKVNVEVPIIEEVNKVLFEGKTSKEAVKTLLARSAKNEKDLVWSLTRREIVQNLSRLGLTKHQATAAVDSFFEGIVKALKDEKKVFLTGFGSWEWRSRRSRQARNPKTGRMVELGNRKALVFKPSPTLKKKLKG